MLGSGAGHRSTVNVEWVKVLRKLDLDLRFEQSSVYHDSMNSFEGSDAPNKVKTQWSVNAPTHIYLHLVPSQVSTIHLASMQLVFSQGVMSPVGSKAQAGRDSRPEFLINIRVIVMLFVAEKPRAHLMRLVFREIKCYLKLPVEGLSWGCLDFDTGDLILKEVFSQFLRGVEEDDRNVQWATVCSSASDLTSSHHHRGRVLEIMPPSMPVAERNRLSA